MLRVCGKLRGSTSCEVQFSTSSKPDKNLYLCVCAYLLFCHLAFKLWQQEIVMKLINAFDVRKYPRHDFIWKHALLAISADHREMKHL